VTTLQNKTALVTGASRGIGRAIATALSDVGARVLVHYGRSAEDVQSLVSCIRDKGGCAEAVRADLQTPNGPASLVQKVRPIIGDRLDVLVCNAGVSRSATIRDHTVEDFDNLFATNVRAPFFLMQQLLPAFGPRSNIVVVSFARSPNRSGQPNPDGRSILAYASTKGAIETLAKTGQRCSARAASV
jgi:NAD(P)-dependent dehydrogenase (short-subunit alcohol dehydrogenase family)